MKFLGRSITFELKDGGSFQQSCEDALSLGLTLISKSAHLGVHKVWILQNVLLLRIRWPILIFGVPFSKIVLLEQKFRHSFESGLSFTTL